MKHYWFKAKRYGYGWYPATWQGWFTTFVWVVLYSKVAFVFVDRMQTTNDVENLFWYIPTIIALTAVLIFISWKTGEPTRWRWGDDDKK